MSKDVFDFVAEELSINQVAQLLRDTQRSVSGLQRECSAYSTGLCSVVALGEETMAARIAKTMLDRGAQYKTPDSPHEQTEQGEQ